MKRTDMHRVCPMIMITRTWSSESIDGEASTTQWFSSSSIVAAEMLDEWSKSRIEMEALPSSTQCCWGVERVDDDSSCSRIICRKDTNAS